MAVAEGKAACVIVVSGGPVDPFGRPHSDSEPRVINAERVLIQKNPRAGRPGIDKVTKLPVSVPRIRWAGASAVTVVIVKPRPVYRQLAATGAVRIGSDRLAHRETAHSRFSTPRGAVLELERRIGWTVINLWCQARVGGKRSRLGIGQDIDVGCLLRVVHIPTAPVVIRRRISVIRVRGKQIVVILP